MVTGKNCREKYIFNLNGSLSACYVEENGELAIRYQYDALNRLIREDNKVMSTTVLYSYDNNGNILKQRKFAFTLKNIIDIEELESEDKVYIYDGDKLLSFNGEECAYNETTGIQTKYRGKSLGWTNRRVSSYKGIEFGYDGQGRRIAKGSISYIYDSQNRLLKQSNGLEFFYDQSGVSSVKYAGNTYFYRKDILGNIIALIDTNGSVVVKYSYDAWGYNGVSDINGNVISDENHIGNLNPFRYNVGASFSLMNQAKQKLCFYVYATRMRPLKLRKKCPCKQAFFCLFCADIITTLKPNCTI